MPLTRVVVFRFDRNPLVCRNKIRLLRRYNPGVKVYGLYGGPGGYRRLAFKTLGRRIVGLDHLFISPHEGRWNWKHGDLALAEWFRRVGRTIAFDVLHFLEWDILLLDSLDRLYAHVPPDAVGLTTLTPKREVEADWEWTTRQDASSEWELLLSHARREWAYDAEPQVCLAGGACLPRSYVERYADTEMPTLCHDELRLPLFAQAQGFRLVDTGFRSGWRSPEEDRFFNVLGAPVARETILAELRDPSGRRAFHPVRTIWRDHTPPSHVS